MPPQQRDDPPARIRLWQPSPVAILGCTAFMASMLGYVLVHTTSGNMEPSTTGSTRNVGNLGHASPREVALSWSVTAATKTLTSERLANLPWWASNSQREKAAVDAVSGISTEKIVDTLLYARDIEAQTRLSTTAAFVERMSDHESCPLQNDVPKNGKAYYPSTVGREASCEHEYGMCYDLCGGGFLSRPVPGSCHVVCEVVKNNCEMCTAKNSTNSKRIGGRIRSWLSAMSPPDIDSGDAPVQDDKSSFTEFRTSWIMLTIWLVQTVGFVVWICMLDGRLSEMRRMHDIINAQEVQGALIVANEVDNVDQREIQENRGIFATSYAFATGWTIDRVRQLEFIAYIHP